MGVFIYSPGLLIPLVSVLHRDISFYDVYISITTTPSVPLSLSTSFSAFLYPSLSSLSSSSSHIHSHHWGCLNRRSPWSAESRA